MQLFHPGVIQACLFIRPVSVTVVESPA